MSPREGSAVALFALARPCPRRLGEGAPPLADALPRLPPGLVPAAHTPRGIAYPRPRSPTPAGATIRDDARSSLRGRCPCACTPPGSSVPGGPRIAPPYSSCCLAKSGSEGSARSRARGPRSVPATSCLPRERQPVHVLARDPWPQPRPTEAVVVRSVQIPLPYSSRPAECPNPGIVTEP